jgi:predicted transglutaminase-like cysteine proteinase
MSDNQKVIIQKPEGIMSKLGKGVFAFLVGVFVFGVIVGVLGGGTIGYMVGVSSSPEVKDLRDYAYNVSEENIVLESLIASIISDRNELEMQNDILKAQYAEMYKSNEKLSKDWQDMRSENLAMSIQISNLKTQLDIEKMKVSSYQKTYSSYTNTPVQTAQITDSATLYYTTGTYPPYTSRPTYPSIDAFTYLTGNIMKFSEAKSFEKLVNDIRAIPYRSHANDNNNYAIQYADETLTTNGGDCTDKALLLYACLKYKGYDEDEMGIASISDCEGKYNHNVMVMTEPPFDTSNVADNHKFDLGGKTWYVVDPTNTAGFPMDSMLAYYDSCYIIGNIHFHNTDTLGGWDAVPIHGLKVSN